MGISSMFYAARERPAESEGRLVRCGSPPKRPSRAGLYCVGACICCFCIHTLTFLLLLRCFCFQSMSCTSVGNIYSLIYSVVLVFCWSHFRVISYEAFIVLLHR